MRRLGCLIIVLIVFGVLFFIGDQVVTTYAEQRTAANVSEALDADTTVAFNGWPVGARLLLGTIPSAEVTATDVPLDNGARLDRLDVELTNVKVDVADLRRDSDRLPPADNGTFVAELSEASVTAMLGLPGNIVEVALVEGVVQLRATGLEVEADVVAQDGDVVVQLRGPLAQLLGGAEFAIDLSGEPGSPEVENVEIRDGVMVVSGTLADVQR
jgi:hypothetical protein